MQSQAAVHRPSFFAVAYLAASFSFTSLGVLLLVKASSHAGGLF